MSYKKELMKLEEWMKKAKKIKNKYKTLNELITDCNKIFGESYATFYISLYKLHMIRPVVSDVDADDLHDSKESISFKEMDGEWFKINTKEMIIQLVERLKDKVTVEKIIEDALSDILPEELTEIFERVVIKRGKVRETEGCYKLVIGGKPGSPIEFMLRG